MQIKDNKLVGVEYDPAKRIKGVIVPKFIVMHYTAGYSVKAARNVFKTTEIAAHLTIGVDGQVLQMVPFNHGCNHSGPSKSHGVEFLNNHSIGIEFVNIGWLKSTPAGLVDAYGNKWKGDPADCVVAKNARVGGATYYWPRYPAAQLNVGAEITKALLAAYPSIKHIVSHEEIDTRGWKTDPGPAFPMQDFQAMLSGRAPPAPAPAPRPATGMHVIMESTVGGLNVRTGPGATYGLATKFPLYEGQRVKMIGGSGAWVKVLINDVAEGWCNGKYLRKV